MARIIALFAGLIMASVTCLAGLQSGPMIGYATMAEVLVWVQTEEAAEVEVVYWPEDNPESIQITDTVVTEKKTGFVAKCIADSVKEGTTYCYEVRLNGIAVEPQFRKEYAEGRIPLTFSTPPNWRFRKQGHAPFDFSFAFGSCAYINEPEGGYDRMSSDTPYGADYQIFESIYEKDPDFFIWLGDNVYYREPDWTSRTGMIHRWTHDRSTPHLRPMLATIPQYAIWDDHDYGPNDIGREYWQKDLATEIFTLFHGNPSAGLPETPGIFTYFAYGDVHFYLLDNRTHRTTRELDPNAFGYQRQQFGKEQVDWLIELMNYNRYQSVSSYPSTFHVVATGNQILSAYDKDGLRQYPEEWAYLFERLAAENLHNVIFITGDVHFSEVSRIQYKGLDIWEVTSSPLTAGPWAGSPAEANPFRVDVIPGEDDRIGQRNFATLSFEGPLQKRQAVIRYFDSDGNLLNQAPGKPSGQPTEASYIPSSHHNLDPKLYP